MLEWGESLEQGKMIGTIGETGRATGPHLHYEIKIGDQNVNPANYLLFLVNAKLQ